MDNESQSLFLGFLAWACMHYYCNKQCQNALWKTNGNI